MPWGGIKTTPMHKWPSRLPVDRHSLEVTMPVQVAQKCCGTFRSSWKIQCVEKLCMGFTFFFLYPNKLSFNSICMSFLKPLKIFLDCTRLDSPNLEYMRYRKVGEHAQDFSDSKGWDQSWAVTPASTACLLLGKVVPRPGEGSCCSPGESSC